MSTQPDPLPQGHGVHPDRRIDIYLGNMVANRHCEIVRRDTFLALMCGCSKQHLKTVDLAPDDPQAYADRLISEIRAAFDCC